ncbi:hypothetical protein ABK040_008083 [Willaertia magna]
MKEKKLLVYKPIINLNVDNVCVSGGATGSDYYWIKEADKYSHGSVVMSFVGHKGRTVIKSLNLKIIEIEKQNLLTADSKLLIANKYLKRSNINYDLLRRNYFIIQQADSVYAIITKLFNKNQSNKDQVRIDGGTAWGCQMFVIEYISKLTNINDIKSLIVCVPLYVFSQDTNKWLQAKCHYNMETLSLKEIDWFEITEAPKPKGCYGAIGTREINSNGIKAIQNIFSKEEDNNFEGRRAKQLHPEILLYKNRASTQNNSMQ